MPDVFISYSVKDSEIAKRVRDYLVASKVDVFLAELSIVKGAFWPKEIVEKLNGSRLVIVLASREACRSSMVNQEIGASVFQGKPVVPIVWDQEPGELPGMLRFFQAIDLRGRSLEELAPALNQIVQRIETDKAWGLVVLGGLVGALYLAFSAK